MPSPLRYAGSIDRYGLDLMGRDPADPSHRPRVVSSTDFAPTPMLAASPGVPGEAG